MFLRGVAGYKRAGKSSYWSDALVRPEEGGTMRRIGRRNAKAGLSGRADASDTARLSLQDATVCTLTKLRVGAGSRAQAGAGKIKVPLREFAAPGSRLGTRRPTAFLRIPVPGSAYKGGS